MEPFLGQIMFFAGNFAPRGWALCDGQLLPIAQNSALFSILGTTYGGDGRTTFALPDLRGRIPLHPGQGPGLSNYVLGQKGGNETTTLQMNNLAPHSHALMASAAVAGDDSPANHFIGRSEIYAGGPAAVTLGSGSVGNAGEGQPFSNVSPYQCINAIIALQGIFPSRG